MPGLSTLLLAVIMLAACSDSSCLQRHLSPRAHSNRVACGAERKENGSPKIALTREAGANDKLKELLKDYSCYELPCIMFDVTEEGVKELPSAMLGSDIIVITSPQAATVFLDSWVKCGRPKNLKIATVGKGSSKQLVEHGIQPSFEPTDSTADALAMELPSDLGKTVLYPSSALAENTLEIGLQKRGFIVRRLNTYDTVPTIWSEDQLAMAKFVDIVTFASPSAAKTWTQKVGNDFTAVVIGPTSYKVCEKLGYTRIHAPDGGSKGIEAWANCIATVADSLSK